MAENNRTDGERRQSQREDARLVRAAQLSPAKFKPLYQKWCLPVYRYFYYRAGSAEDAEDLTSKVFVKVLAQLPKYHERGCFSAWLFTLARNEIANFIRAGHSELSLDSLELADHSADPLAVSVQHDELVRLRGLIQALPEEEKELIRLRFVAGLEYGEISILLGRKAEAVRKATARLLHRLQEQLEVNHE